MLLLKWNAYTLPVFTFLDNLNSFGIVCSHRIYVTKSIVDVPITDKIIIIMIIIPCQCNSIYFMFYLFIYFFSAQISCINYLSLLLSCHSHTHTYAHSHTHTHIGKMQKNVLFFCALATKPVRDRITVQRRSIANMYMRSTIHHPPYNNADCRSD